MPMIQEVVDSTWKITLDKLYETPEGKQILSCIQCGVCAGTCPYGEYMDYPPRRIIKMLQAGLIAEVFESDSLLKCVACFSCMAKCPRNIRLTEVLLPLVKEQTILRLPQMPSELQKAVENTYRYGNPMGESGRKRAAWVKTAGVPVRILAEDGHRPVDVLWFVECDLSYHSRGQDVARATAKVFNALGIDFGVLGPEEKCAGDCGRLSWEPGLSETLIDYNLATFRKYRFNKIVTNDPHAFDAFKYRYTMFGFKYNIEPTVSFIHSYRDQLRPMLKKKLSYTVTYHDSCCLGRHNGFYEEPRALLQTIPGITLVEMTHNRLNSICCGGGGGGNWLDTYYKSKGMERLSERRAKEAVATGADVLAVACPYEVPRFEDALKVLGQEKRIIVRDITELLAESLGGE
jgi:Fe-S oxidoreductase